MFFYYENNDGKNLSLLENSSHYLFDSKEEQQSNYDFTTSLLFKDKETKNWANSNERLPLDYFKGIENENIYLEKEMKLRKVYYDNIKKNIFSKDSYTNYVKLLYFKFKHGKTNTYSTGLIGMRIDKKELIKLINNADRNLTVIYQRLSDDENSEGNKENKPQYGIIPCTNYLDYFYKFAFAIDPDLIKNIQDDTISYSSETIIKIHQWKSFNLGILIKQTFNNLAIARKYLEEGNKNNNINIIGGSENSTQLLINYHFLREIIYMGFFMTTAIRKNFQKDYGSSFIQKLVDKNNEKNEKNKTIVSETEINYNEFFCKFGPDTNSKRIILDQGNSKINDVIKITFDFCDYLEHMDTTGKLYPYDKTYLAEVKEEMEKHGSAQEKKEMKIREKSEDPYTKQVHNLKYFNIYQKKYKLFVAGNDNSAEINSLGNKSFWTYISNINGLKMIFFEMMNFENYINLRVSFKDDIKKDFDLIYYLTVSTAVLSYLIIINVSFNFVNYSKKKLMAIKVINENLFYYSISINYLKKSEHFLEGPIESQMIQFIKDCYEKNVRKADIMKLEDNDIDYLKTNIYLSVKYKRKLVNIMKCVLNGKFSLQILNQFI